MRLELPNYLERGAAGLLDNHATTVRAAELEEPVTQRFCADAWVHIALPQSGYQVIDIALGCPRQSLSETGGV
jgi:hypothetical protein